MAIVIPTIDDFTDTTVLRMIRKIVDYLINTLVPTIKSEFERVDNRITNTQNKLNELITQFNTMVEYIGSDEHLVTNTVPTTVNTITVDQPSE